MPFLEDGLSYLSSLAIKQTSVASMVDSVNYFLQQISGEAKHNCRVFIRAVGIRLERDAVAVSVGDVTFRRAEDFDLGQYNITELERDSIQKFLTSCAKGCLAETEVSATTSSIARREAVKRIRDTMDVLHFRDRSVVLPSPHETSEHGFLIEFQPGELRWLRFEEKRAFSDFYVLGPEETPALGEIQSRIWNGNRTSLKCAIQRAMFWQGTARTNHSNEVRLLALVTALEALLLSGARVDWKRNELKRRCAAFAGILEGYRDDHLRALDRLYRLRSSIVHGSAHTASTLEHDCGLLTWLVNRCIDRSLRAQDEGCNSVEELLRWNTQTIEESRRVALEALSDLSTSWSPIEGDILCEKTGTPVGEFTGQARIVDEGEDGFAYSRIDVQSHRLHEKVSSDERLILRARIGQSVLLLQELISEDRASIFFCVTGTKAFKCRANKCRREVNPRFGMQREVA